MVSGNRDVTTVATQALYLLNDPFVRRHSLNLSRNLLDQSGGDDAARVNQAYRLVLGRHATPEETARGVEYLRSFEEAAAASGGFDRQLVSTTATAGSGAVGAAGSVSSTPASSGPVGDDEQPPDPDQIIHSDAPVKAEALGPIDSRTAAWMSFCQALFGTVECRYLK